MTKAAVLMAMLGLGFSGVPAVAQTSGGVQTAGGATEQYFWAQDGNTIWIYNHTAKQATCSFQYSSTAQADAGSIEVEANGRADPDVKARIISGFTLWECHPAQDAPGP